MSNPLTESKVYGPFQHPQPKLIYLVHIAGNSPNSRNDWSKPYSTLSVAKTQAMRMITEYPPAGYSSDWTTTIYKVDVVNLTVDKMAQYNAWEV